jgi:Tfp pilus assembly protein PilO
METTSRAKLKVTQVIVIMTAIFIIICVSSYFFVMSPFLKNYNKYQKELSIEKKEADDKFKKNVTIDNLFKDIKGTEQQIQKLNSIYINPNRELELITNLEEIAGKNKIKQEINFNRDSDKGAKKFRTFIIQINTAGKFKDLIAYLSDLEDKNYYINIFSLDITQSGSDIFSDATMNFSANVYVNNLN